MQGPPSSPSADTREPRRVQHSYGDYGEPPVHEVVLDLVFEPPQPEYAILASLQAVQEDLSRDYPHPQRVEASSFEVVATPGLPPSVQTTTVQVGWKFEASGLPRWMVRTLIDRLTVNSVRSDDWPAGDYIGWDAILDRFNQLLPRVRPAYAALKPRRFGLRYVNRIAIAADSDLDDVLTVGFRRPEGVRDLSGFTVRQTWKSIDGFDDLAATVAVARITMDDKKFGGDSMGVLLDIDIFNLSPTSAPAYDDIAAWYKRAHDAERKVFEACVTPGARKQFREHSDAAA